MKVCIEKFDYEGRGLCHIDGKVTFVPKALNGEVVDISLEKSEKYYNIAKLKEIRKVRKEFLLFVLTVVFVVVVLFRIFPMQIP